MKPINAYGGRVRYPLDEPEIVRLHTIERLSVKQIASRFDVARHVIVDRLKRAGVVPRNRSQAMFERMRSTTPEERQRLSAAAHSAVRGRKQSEIQLVTRAAARKESAQTGSVELVFAERFKLADLHPRREFAIGIYNVDFAFPEAMVAVEIDPGNWHTAPRKAAIDARKDEFLRQRGWLVLRWSGNRLRSSNPRLAEECDRLIAQLQAAHLTNGDSSTSVQLQRQFT